MSDTPPKSRNIIPENWVREQFDSDPLLDSYEPIEGVVDDHDAPYIEDPFSSFAFETAGIAIERRDLPLASWLLGSLPADGFLESIPATQVPTETGVAVQVYNRQLALFRKEDGSIVACDDECPHAGAPLHNGIVRGDELMCAWHGWTFDLETGETPVNEHTPLHFYPVELRDGIVYISLK